MSTAVKKNAKNMFQSARKVFQFRQNNSHTNTSSAIHTHISEIEDGGPSRLNSGSGSTSLILHTSPSDEGSHHSEDHDHDSKNSNSDWQYVCEEPGEEHDVYANRIQLRESELSRESLVSSTTNNNNVCMDSSHLPTHGNKMTESDAIIALLSRTQSAVAQSLLVLNNLEILTKEVCMCAYIYVCMYVPQ